MQVLKIGVVVGPNHIVVLLTDVRVSLSVVEEMVGEYLLS
jgi:hypothetical protein